MVVRWRCQGRAHWRLVRWAKGWALLVPLPIVAQSVWCVRTLLGVQVGSEFCLLLTRGTGGRWQPTAEWRGRWKVQVPLPAQWQLIEPPRTVQWEGQKWLLLPLQRHTRSRQ